MRDFSCFLISTYGDKKISVQKMMLCSFIWLEISFILLEQGECLMSCVFWQDECETTTKEIMKKSYHEDEMKMILNKFEGIDGCKGKGSFRVISILMNKFKDQ
jgi:hypothetical protein